MFGQKTVELVGKGMGVFLAEGFGTFQYLAAITQLFHQVAHGQVLFDVLSGVELAAVIDGVGIFRDDTVSQRDVCRDDKITRLYHLHDAVIGLVGAGIDDLVGDMVGASKRDAFVGDDTGFKCEAFDGTQQDRFEKVWKGIPVDEESHE